MQIKISSAPSYAVAYITLSAGESIECETDAMVAMSMGIEITSGTAGTLMNATIRKYAAGETFFRTRYRSTIEGGWVALASKYPGDVSIVKIDGNELLVQSGSVLASSHQVLVESRFSGISTMIQKEGFVVSKVTGFGELLICAYGGIEKIELGPNQNLIVDTGHLVAWSTTLGMKIGPLDSAIKSATTGEGLVALLTGPGELYIQTRSERGIRQWLFPKRNAN